MLVNDEEEVRLASPRRLVDVIDNACCPRRLSLVQHEAQVAKPTDVCAEGAGAPHGNPTVVCSKLALDSS